MISPGDRLVIRPVAVLLVPVTMSMGHVILVVMRGWRGEACQEPYG